MLGHFIPFNTAFFPHRCMCLCVRVYKCFKEKVAKQIATIRQRKKDCAHYFKHQVIDGLENKEEVLL